MSATTAAMNGGVAKPQSTTNTNKNNTNDNPYKSLASQGSSKMPSSGNANNLNLNTPIPGVNNLAEELYGKFNEALQKTKDEVQDVKKKVQEYDEKFQATDSVKKQQEKASEYFNSTLTAVKEALDDLTEKTKNMFNEGSEVPMKAISRAIASVNTALENLRKLAKEYDEKYGITMKVSDVINPARERMLGYLSEVSTYATNVSKGAMAQMLGVNDGLKKYISGISTSGLNFLISKAADLDNKFDIESKVKQLDEKYKVRETVKELDEKYKVVETTEGLVTKLKSKGEEVDSKITGGKATGYLEEAYASGYKLVTEGFEKLASDFDNAKRNSRENLDKMN